MTKRNANLKKAKAALVAAQNEYSRAQAATERARRALVAAEVKADAARCAREE